MLQHSPRNAEFWLKRAAPVPLPPTRYLDHLFRLRHSNRLKHFLDRHFLGACLLFGSPREKLRHVLQLQPDLIRKIFPEQNPEYLSNATWTDFPVPVTRGDSSILLTCFLGLLPGKTKKIFYQTAPPVHKTAREAIQTAFQLHTHLNPSRKNVLLFWTSQDEDDPPLQGKSLGLPTALALYLLHKKKPWPPDLYATGMLSERGRIRPVKNIAGKRNLLDGKNGLFIVPSTHCSTVSDQKITGVENLREALLILELHLSGTGSIPTALCRLAAQDPQTLLTQFDQLPDQFFSLFDLSEVLSIIRNNPEKYLGQLAACLQKNSYSVQHPKFLKSLPQPQEIAKLENKHILNSMQYCLGQLACWNHLGAPEQSRKWGECARDLAAACPKKRKISQLANNDFVRERFNRFDFRPELPELFVCQLNHEKELYHFQQEDSWQLGAMYGTLAQNFGFCGVKYSHQLKRTADMAISAFGPTFSTEHPRIYSYVIYSLLDNHQWKKAETALQHCLKLSAITSNPGEWLNKLNNTQQSSHQYDFQLCLLCRFLADISDRRKIRIDPEILRHNLQQTLLKNKHPWQFTAVNLSRLYMMGQEKEPARKLLDHALCLCASHGETMQALGLLPLAFLHEYGLAETIHFDQAKTITERIQTRKALNQSHFQVLFDCNSGKNILERAYKRREELFPFSYR